SCVTNTREINPVISAFTSVCLSGHRAFGLPLESTTCNEPEVSPDLAEAIGTEFCKEITARTESEIANRTSDRDRSWQRIAILLGRLSQRPDGPRRFGERI